MTKPTVQEESLHLISTKDVPYNDLNQFHCYKCATTLSIDCYSGTSINCAA